MTRYAFPAGNWTKLEERYSDACDVCFHAGAQNTLSKPRMTLSTCTFPYCASLLQLKAAFTVPWPPAPALDPVANGIEIAVIKQDGTSALKAPYDNVVIPGGAFDGTTGWRARGNKWIYADKSWAPPGGIRKVIIKDMSRREPGLLRVVAKGGAPGRWSSVQPGDEPFYVGIELNAAVDGGLASQCGEGTLAAEQCDRRTHEDFATVRCR